MPSRDISIRYTIKDTIEIKSQPYTLFVVAAAAESKLS